MAEKQSSSLRLDDEQRAAATAVERFVRVRAGAGTGKTTCGVARVRYLVQVADVRPRDICFITFSKRASEEIKHRVGSNGIDATIGTIHSLGYRILQFERMGRPVADDRKRSQYVLKAIKACGSRDSLQWTKAQIARARAFGVPYPPEVAEVGQSYENLLHADGLWDFDDLLLQPTMLLSQDQNVHDKWRRRFLHVLVDEAQDTSDVQWDLIEHLIGVGTNLYIIGDPGQSIYGWRGAARDGMLEAIEQRFGQPFATYTLSQNYRSAGMILDAANRVLVGKKEHVAVQEARGDAVPVLPIIVGGTYHFSARETFRRALRVIVETGISLPDVVVLGRTHALLGECEAACVQLGVPYIVAGGFSFYDRTEIKDVMAYLEYAADVEREAALERFFNRPSRYLGKVWIEALQAQGGWVRWEQVGAKGFHWSQRYMGPRAAELWEICLALRKWGPQARALDVLTYVLDVVGYRAWMRDDGLTEAEASEDNDAEENLDALLAGAGDRTVQDFVAFVDQCRRQPKRIQTATGAVTLSTIHRAKGLEWPVVVLAGLEEGILPHKRGDAEGEERRLYYVGVSRARDALVLAVSGDPEADVEGKPSRYVQESLAVLGITGVLPEIEAGDDAVDAEYVADVPLLPAPEGDAYGLEASDGGRAGGDRADGAPAGGARSADGSAGIGGADDGECEAGGADDSAGAGVCGDMEPADD